MPLGGWDSLDRLAATRQPEDTLASDQYDKFKTVVKGCKVSGINFAVMCSANIDMANVGLKSTGEMTKNATYKSGTYFHLKDDKRKLVDDRAEEIYLSTRFLSLSSKNSTTNPNKSSRTTSSKVMTTILALLRDA